MLVNKFYFDELYQYVIDRGVLGFSYVVAWFDRYVVNDTGIDGSAQITGYSGFIMKYLQTGRVPNYAMAYRPRRRWARRGRARGEGLIA